MNSNAKMVARERMADDRRNRAIALDEQARAATFVGMLLLVRGRGVRVTRMDEGSGYVWFTTWPEGRGERSMRCCTTWRRWRVRYWNHREASPRRLWTGPRPMTREATP